MNEEEKKQRAAEKKAERAARRLAKEQAAKDAAEIEKRALQEEALQRQDYASARKSEIVAHAEAEASRTHLEIQTLESDSTARSGYDSGVDIKSSRLSPNSLALHRTTGNSCRPAATVVDHIVTERDEKVTVGESMFRKVGHEHACVSNIST